MITWGRAWGVAFIITLFTLFWGGIGYGLILGGSKLIANNNDAGWILYIIGIFVAVLGETATWIKFTSECYAEAVISAKSDFNKNQKTVTHKKEKSSTYGKPEEKILL
jgi:hypothetical protein